MACPDKNRDARIIAELERRKAFDAEIEQPQTIDYILHEWYGALEEILFFHYDKEKIVSIEKMESGHYIAKIEV